MRTPFQGERERETASVRSRLGEAIRYMWHQPFLRTSALIFGPLNFVGFGLIFSLVVIGSEQGLGGGAIGLLLSAFFGCRADRNVPRKACRAPRSRPGSAHPRAVDVDGCVAFVIWPNVYVLAASMLPSALAMPSTDSVVHGYRIAMTPERLLGRAEAAWSTFAILMATFGAARHGLPDRARYPRAPPSALCAVLALGLAVWGTSSRPIRDAPTIDELAEVPG